MNARAGQLTSRLRDRRMRASPRASARPMTKLISVSGTVALTTAFSIGPMFCFTTDHVDGAFAVEPKYLS